VTASQLDPAIVVDDLAFTVGGFSIIHDLSLTVGRGEFLGVIGPNGAGKTTFLNLLSGTVRPTGGRIRLHGRDVTATAPHRRARLGLGRTFQTSYVLLGLSVLENVRLMVQARSVRGLALLRRVSGGDPTIERAMAALERVGLADKAGREARELSHGDRRKLELAIVVAAEAAVVLLDEPMAGVNSEDIGPLTDLIRELHAGSGSTFLLVEHHLPVVLDLASRVAVLHEGTLLAEGPADAVMDDVRVQSAYLGEPA
jgi:branched-chain amino acid transport system ATP-binding protein